MENAWNAIDKLLSIITKSDLSDKIKRDFLQAVTELVRLYGCTTMTLTKHFEKKLDGNYARMPRLDLNKSWKQHTSKQQLYGHLPPISQIIQVIRTFIQCSSKVSIFWDYINNVLLLTPTHRHTCVDDQQRLMYKLCVNTGCSLEDLQERWTVVTDGEKERERENFRSLCNNFPYFSVFCIVTLWIWSH